MKKICSMLLTLSMLISCVNVALASGNPVGEISPDIKVSAAGSAISSVLGVIQWIGYAFAIGMLIYIGIKYMMSAANEKADLKKGLINYVIGAILVAATATIAGWVINFGSSLKAS